MSAIPLDPDEKVVGIDLGTTNSIIATFEAGEPVVVSNAEGERCTPSVVAFDKDGEVLVGHVARRQAVLNPLNTFQSVKRFIGRRYSEIEGEVGAFPYKILDVDGQACVDCPVLGRPLKPAEISAHVLRKLKTDAEGRLNCKVKKAVISVPAYFNDTQRQATKSAGKMAGLEVLRIVNEPTMAALAYGLDQRNLSTLLILDLGGGTFDVSCLEVGDGVIEVMAVNGDTNLGGNDFDQLIVNFVLQAFQKKEGVDLRKDPQALARVLEACERAKIELSELNETRISIPFIAMSDEGPLHVDEKLTQEQLTEMCVDTITRTGDPIFKCLKDGQYRMKDVTQVVHVGGATRMLGVQAFWADITNYQNVNNSINPEEVVAIGAAVHAAMVVGETRDIVLIDVTPLTLGVETNGGVFTPVIERNTAIPTKGTRLFTTSEDAQDSIEVVVLQGERPMAADNTALESFRLEGIPPAPAGIPKIEVTFEIDRDGILAVSAKDWATRRVQKVVLADTQNVEEKVVEETVQAAEDLWEADEDKKEKLELVFSAKYLAHKTRENIADLGTKIPEDANSSLMPRLELLEKAVVKAVAAEEGGERIDYEELNMLTQDLRFELMKLGPRVWGKQIAPDNMPGPAKSRPPGGAASGGLGDTGVYVDMV